MKAKLLIVWVGMALLAGRASAQCYSNQSKPDWANGYSHDNETSFIEVVTAVGASEEEARNKAFGLITERSSFRTGYRVKVESINGKTLTTGADELTVKARVIDEYRETCGNEYRVHLLVEIVKNPSSTYYPGIGLTDRYSAGARVLAPGMAQIYKGSAGKGAVFIVGEALCVGGIVVSEMMRANSESKMNATHDAAVKRTHADNADTWATARNVAIGGAAAVYVWNVIDGMVARGKRRVTINGRPLTMTPYATPRDAGVLLSWKF